MKQDDEQSSNTARTSHAVGRAITAAIGIAVLAWEVFYVGDFVGIPIVVGIAYLYVAIDCWLASCSPEERRRRIRIWPFRIIVVWGAVSICLTIAYVV